MLVYATQPTEMGDLTPFSGQKLRQGSASRWLRSVAGMSTPIHNNQYEFAVIMHTMSLSL